MMDNTIPWFLDRLKGVRANGTGWHARCPFHPDKSPSLSIDRGGKGWLLHCHTGCTFREVMGALALPLNAAFYDYDAPTQVYDIDVDAREWWGKPKTWTMCRQAHYLEDVAWLTYPQAADMLARANAETHPYSGLPFEEAMSMWLTSGQAWLDYWMAERWLMAGGQHKIGWTEFSRWMHDQMWTTYLQRGCSGSLCGESQSLGQGLPSVAHTIQPSTQSGRIR